MSDMKKRVTSLAGGTLAEATCQRCGTECAWAFSKRTGRWYLCALFPKTVPRYSDNAGSRAMRAAPWVPHNCDMRARV